MINQTIEVSVYGRKLLHPLFTHRKTNTKRINSDRARSFMLDNILKKNYRHIFGQYEDF